MPDPSAGQESLGFRAEVRQLLNILAHSLYTEREIFLRELISNASDALNRIQFVMLTDREVLDPEAELAIRVDYDREAHTVTVSDSGIGMTRAELIENLGTIAHSGAAAFLKSLDEGQRPADIIGQFGVGFYAVFMAADEVTVTTRSHRPGEPAWRWASMGGDRFTLEPAEKESRGTEVRLKLKDDAHEFASAWRLEQIVRRHSNYLSFPIYVEGKVVNQRDALWRKPLNEVQDSEYTDFYRQLTLDAEPPLLHVHIITDAPVDMRSLLYIPRRMDRSGLRWQTAHGPRLYSKKVLIQEHSPELLPEYLRFVDGVVDSEDLPLNISRETVQSNRVLRQIQKALTGRLLKALKDLAQERPEDYRSFWQEFGPFIKQGVAMSPGDHDDLLPLLRLPSSRSGGEQISLADYAGRVAPGQQEIYYLIGAGLGSVEASPHLDAFKARGLEVLYLVDPLDGLMMQGLREYQGQPLRNVDDPGLELPPLAEQQPETQQPAPTEGLDTLLARFRAVLGERVTEVRPSRLLTGSPARLVSADAGSERDLQRVRRYLDQDYRLPAKILEVNPSHAIIRNLEALLAARPDDPLIPIAIEQLFDNLLLVEGMHPNPAEMAPRLQALVEAATRP